MMNAEIRAPIAPSPNRSAAGGRIPPARPTRPSIPASLASNLFSITYMAVEMDGRNLWKERAEVAVAQLCEAIRLADLRGKSELLIEDIAPWIGVGQADTRRVPVIQERIERHLEAACRELGHDMPVCRLDLNRNRFALRCYLGRMKPTDYLHPEDLFSDNR